MSNFHRYHGGAAGCRRDGCIGRIQGEGAQGVEMGFIAFHPSLENNQGSGLGFQDTFGY